MTKIYKGINNKDNGNYLESRLRDSACSADFTFPLARWAPMQPATINPTFDLCTRYPLRLGGPRQCGMQSLPNNSTHDQHWESKPTPSDPECLWVEWLLIAVNIKKKTIWQDLWEILVFGWGECSSICNSKWSSISQWQNILHCQHYHPWMAHMPSLREIYVCFVTNKEVWLK